ncbi:MAG: Na+/H+ antiporter NhaA [Candidatus Nanopelagicales bacterium]
MGEQLFERPSLAERSWLLRVLRAETVGGILMLVAALVALVWANTQWAYLYVDLISTTIGPEALHLNLPISVWAADFLLAFFFFLAGLELKHEVQLGTLSKPSLAAVPVVAALGGMVVPAVLYLVMTRGLPLEQSGWGIPMATDIAFALAVLAIMGRGLPLALRAFLLTLAVVDDLGAITVIAIFYSNTFELGYLVVSVALVALWWVLQRRRFVGTKVSGAVYVTLFLLTWYTTHESGVHATVAGVALGLATRVVHDPGEEESPGDRAEHLLRPFVAGVAVPLFAFASAGVTIRDVGVSSEPVQSLADTVSEPVTLGVLAGLLIGKPIGVFAGAWLTARFTRAALNPTLRWADVAAVGMLGGIGFTVSLLIAELAFKADPGLLINAKVGILAGTIGAAILSTLLLRHRRRALDLLVAAENVDVDADGIPDIYQREG